jgi:hypothetical protein
VKVKSRRKLLKSERKPLDKVLQRSVSEGPKRGASQKSGKSSAVSPTKKKRGRPRKMQWDWVTGRASNYEHQLSEVWPKLEAPLLAARIEDEVTTAFRDHAEPHAQEFTPRLASDILALMSDRKFPKRASPRIKFLARSLAGRPSLSFRTSRDICEKVHVQENLKSPHRILSREFYIECSCGYQGPARNNACRKCGAATPLSLHEWTGLAPLNPSIEDKARNIPAKQPLVKQETVLANPAASNHVECECGAAIAAPSREIALKALAEHKRLVHGEINQDEQTEKPE